jgi:hypothetical protein
VHPVRSLLEVLLNQVSAVLSDVNGKMSVEFTHMFVAVIQISAMELVQ